MENKEIRPHNHLDLYNKLNPTNFVKTPENVARKLYEMCKKVCPSAKTCIDPCAGDGALDIGDYQYNLFDIEPRRNDIQKDDFLNMEITKHYDVAVVNPPFNKKFDFIDKCFTIADYVAVIAPYRSLVKRYSKYIEAIETDFIYNFKFDNVTSTLCLAVLNKNRAGEPYKRSPCRWPVKSKYFYDYDKNLENENKYFIFALYIWVEKIRYAKVEKYTKDLFLIKKSGNNGIRKYNVGDKKFFVMGALYDSKEEAESACERINRMIDEKNLDFYQFVRLNQHLGHACIPDLDNPLW